MYTTRDKADTIQYVPSSTNTTFTIHNPTDNTVVSDVIQSASQQDVDDAVKAAKAALPAWKNLASSQRAAIINKFADLLEANADSIAKLETACMGQPINIARHLILDLIPVWRYYAGLAGNIAGEAYPPDGDGDGRYKIVSYEPLGVCAGITAWNATHALTALKIAPALAAGNTFILKSSEKSPLGLAQYGHLINEAGFPPGVFSVIAGDGIVGNMLSSHMSIAKISFTGSTNAGRAVQIAAAKSNLKHVTLELGGKSPALIFDDADLDTAIASLSDGFLFNSGQICYASSRALVQEGIVPDFLKALKVAYEKAAEKMGDPSLEDTFLGPLVDSKQLDHVMKFLDTSKADGIEVLTGGDRKGTEGNFVQPTVFVNPALDSKIYTDEIFGPVLCIR